MRGRSIFHRANQSHEGSGGSSNRKKVLETRFLAGAINSRLDVGVRWRGNAPLQGTRILCRTQPTRRSCCLSRMRVAQKSQSPLNTGRRDGSFHVERSRLNDNASVALSKAAAAAARVSSQRASNHAAETNDNAL